jgi:MarR family transcriptional regulator, transcriptional regulator for hemolysin
VNVGIIDHMSTTVDIQQVDEAPPEALAQDLCWLLARASQLLNLEAGAALEELGITQRQYSVLVTALTGEHTQTDLARIVGLDKTTLMVTVDELERLGLAERRPLPSDRRARLVAVTDAGADVLTRAEGKLNRSREGVLALLPDDERACFLQGLARLACAHQDDLPACCAAASDS